MIPHHLVLLLAAIGGWSLLTRYGRTLFLAYALYHFYLQQWGYAAIAFGLACVFDHLKRWAMFWARLEGYRGPWL